MYCSKCGKENPEDSQFCQGCAAALKADVQASAPVPPVQQNVYVQPEKPKKKKKKWWIALIVVFIIFIFFWALGSGGSSSDESTKEPNNVVAENDSNKSNVGDYNVEIKESGIATDYEGNKILIVTYTFTNNSKEAKSFNLSVTDTAFQDGVELGTVWSSYGIDGLSFDNKSKEIKPGKTLDVQCAYELNDETTNVEIEFTLFSIWTDKVYETFVIKLK